MSAGVFAPDLLLSFAPARKMAIISGCINLLSAFWKVSSAGAATSAATTTTATTDVATTAATTDAATRTQADSSDRAAGIAVAMAGRPSAVRAHRTDKRIKLGSISKPSVSGQWGGAPPPIVGILCVHAW